MGQTQKNIPLFNTTLSELPLSFFEKNIINQSDKIESWLSKQWQKTPPFFSCSVDLRNAGFKLAPVDANLFPAGFNNLRPEFMDLYSQAARTTIQQLLPDTQKIVLIPENHTRNLFYLESLAVLSEILKQAGFSVKISSLGTEFTDSQSLFLPSGRQIIFEPFHRDKMDVNKTLILLNNDLSDGVPDILENFQHLIHPAIGMGWSFRLKSVHFSHYKAIAEEFAECISIDPWLISPLFYHCGEIDFMKHEGEDCLVHNTNFLIKAIEQKYNEYGIKNKPFVVVKADSGTYGMAVMMVHDAEELRHLNRKKRTHMSASKGGKTVSKVIIQEGVHTIETCNNASAEPVIYIIGQQVIGGFYRAHTKRGADDNLNSPGMYFQPFSPINNNNFSPHDPGLRFYSYSVVARLSALACAREFKGL